MHKIKTIIETRIAELNAADSEFCKDRWDPNLHMLQKAIAREGSLISTFARQELQELLKKIEAQEPVKKKCFIIHKFNKWQQYEVPVTYPNGTSYEIRQKRCCSVCGKMEDKRVR